ncbi:MAG: sulfotransferase [Firmicutes bacterium]|nr:sulfotransferase [Alicyclobacillaceae bacterium]MCL6496051.1 sulfotransferase [Bacillota bacterium]
MSSRPPILVTGAHRSGTTWVGRMLCLSGEAGYIDEPFNCDRVPGWLPEPVPHWYQYVCRDNEAEYLAALEALMTWRYPVRHHVARLGQQGGARRLAADAWNAWHHRVARRRPLIKDPLALFSAPWMADRLGVRVVVLVRHPAAFASSLKRLGWHFDFRHWAEQPLLLRDWLSPFAAEIEQASRTNLPLLDQATLLWNAIYATVHRWQRTRPDFLFVRYEALAADPVTGMRWLYSRLGLAFTPAVARRVAAWNGPDQPAEVMPHDPGPVRRNSRAARYTWLRRLEAEEIAQIKAATAAVARHYYGPEDWPEVIPLDTRRRSR